MTINIIKLDILTYLSGHSSADPTTEFSSRAIYGPDSGDTYKLEIEHFDTVTNSIEKL